MFFSGRNEAYNSEVESSAVFRNSGTANSESNNAMRTSRSPRGSSSSSSNQDSDEDSAMLCVNNQR
jgi:hypothetical protein